MKSLYQYFLKSLLVGAVYVTTQIVTKLLLSEPVDARTFLWTLLGGAVTGLVLGSLAASMPAILPGGYSKRKRSLPCKSNTPS